MTSDLPGWVGTRGVILIAPALGARFTQYLAVMEPNGAAAPAPPGVERAVYVLEGEIALTTPDLPARVLCRGGFAYWPPGSAGTFRALTACRLNVFEKRYAPRPGSRRPRPSAARSVTSTAILSSAIPTPCSRSSCRLTRSSTWR